MPWIYGVHSTVVVELDHHWKRADIEPTVHPEGP